MLIVKVQDFHGVAARGRNACKRLCLRWIWFNCYSRSHLRKNNEQTLSLFWSRARSFSRMHIRSFYTFQEPDLNATRPDLKDSNAARTPVCAAALGSRHGNPLVPRLIFNTKTHFLDMDLHRILLGNAKSSSDCCWNSAKFMVNNYCLPFATFKCCVSISFNNQYQWWFFYKN